MMDSIYLTRALSQAQTHSSEMIKQLRVLDISGLSNLQTKGLPIVVNTDHHRISLKIILLFDFLNL